RMPALAGAALRAVGDGWTCDTYEVTAADGAVWIVQSPRTAYAAERLRAQAALLPELAHGVSATIPTPAVPLGDPPLLIYPRIEGVPCDEAGGGIWPERLGRFLYDLHAVPPEFVGLRALTPARLREATRATCADLAAGVLPSLGLDERARAEAMLGALLDDDEMWRFAPVLTHGDLGPAHVLVTSAGDLAGIIDWEEAALDDPVVDLAWWLHAAPASGERALEAYGGAPDRRFRDRARIRFALMPWHEVAYGLGAGGPAFVESGLAGVRDRLV
ncbi:MAG TPA: phosphotransferase, partial [Actinomycetota bacterium]|nr:phosphotransferase [Actinomycetota bacterium]